MLIALLLALLSAPPTMKAIQIQSFGGPEVLQVVEVPRPVPRGRRHDGSSPPMTDCFV